MAAASVGFTPGGLGVIEVALATALVAAGVARHRAVAAVFLYRLISFWIVVAVGWSMLAVLGRRHDPASNPPLAEGTTVDG
jgi:uncharacterized protein (TIRG00374 family)